MGWRENNTFRGSWERGDSKLVPPEIKRKACFFDCNKFVRLPVTDIVETPKQLLADFFRHEAKDGGRTQLHPQTPNQLARPSDVAVDFPLILQA
ncbi:unnamed protein product [Protopolystoma xenopodis]|uniref:Uncharacterized protein n=1 Tax=Protopolystoma xenopodis TaxID=117903 RepID=A0A448XLM0_9PLAT|nr:unnamed protein product [Protopolystoma xenopodis]